MCKDQPIDTSAEEIANGAELYSQRDHHKILAPGLSVSHGLDGWWLHFDGGNDEPKSSISIAALGDGSLRAVDRPGVLAWLEAQEGGEG